MIYFVKNGRELTADEVRFAKKANTMVFTAIPERECAVMRVSHNSPDGDIFREPTMEIPINVSVDTYDKGRSLRDIKRLSTVVMHCDHAERTRTFLSMLRKGDVVEAQWTLSNNSDLLREVELHSDELEAVIVRGNKRITFLLDVSVSKMNSARCVQYQEAV